MVVTRVCHTCDVTVICVDPERSYDFPKEYLERVKKVHQYGGFGSEGYDKYIMYCYDKCIVH